MRATSSASPPITPPTMAPAWSWCSVDAAETGCGLSVGAVAGVVVMVVDMSDDVCGKRAPPVSVDEGVGDVEGKEEKSEGVSVGVRGKENMEPGRVGPGSNMLPGGETDGGVNSGLENPGGESIGDGCGGKMGSEGSEGRPRKGGIDMMMIRSLGNGL